MTKGTWLELQQRGVTEDDELRLDFSYRAPDESRASALVRHLADETDYEVRTEATGGGFLRGKRWAVAGTTRGTNVSAEILDQWVTWMVVAGFKTGCEFDGWGTMVHAR